MKIKAFIEGATTPSTSRWGIFTSLLATAALFFAISDIDINICVITGIVFTIMAIALMFYWIITGSRDITATKYDISNLEQKIDKLDDKIIKLLRENSDKRTA
ncbi:MAG: hypothetical protein A9183_04895 [Dehalococcoides mccartyi]|uniref:hypothetical protein n=1 Tax=Dehalococcoides mccartyi TaxID=61435 RepID=UPI0008050505|nr:hypothetical protein [Dehalococcoides mccartyi]OBW62649.1 MAG: hypothetical protein A9183_04895 [Dehalococcoides mccartyi]